MLNNQDFTRDRHLYIGGSDIGAILGLSPYRTPLDVWMEKTGKVVNRANNLAIRFGTYAEDFVAKEYALQTELNLIEYPHPISHPLHEHLVGHIDRFVIKNGLGLEPLFDANSMCTASHILECKTANPFNQSQWGDSGTDQVPLPYLVQCLWYLAITNLERADLAVLFSNQDFRIYSIARDMELEKIMIEKALAFWNEYVLADIAPPASNTADYQTLFPKANQGQTIEADQSLYELVQKLNHLQTEIKERDSEIECIKEAVMRSMQDSELLTFQGQTLATWKQPKASHRFDTKLFASDYPELYTHYQSPITSSRRLVIKPIATSTTITP